MAPGDVVGKGALVEYLHEQLKALVVPAVLENLGGIDALVLVLLEEFQLPCELAEELLLVAVFGKVDVFEFGQPVFAEPGQTVLLPKRTLLLPLPFENPELVVSLLLFLLLRVVPAVGSQKACHILAVPQAFADLIGVS